MKKAAAVVGGTGGGRPDMAQAGGPQSSPSLTRHSIGRRIPELKRPRSMELQGEKTQCPGFGDEPGLRGEEEMNINESSEVYGRITRVINELKMARQSVTIFKVVELTGIDQFVVFQ